MSFEEYLRKLSFAGWSNYVKWVNEVCAYYGMSISDLTISNIDNVITDVTEKDRLKFIRGKHGNSHGSAIKKYKEYLLLFSTVNPTLATKGSCQRTFATSYKTPPMGFDGNCYYVSYAEDVEENERIPGLCEYLESEYKGILGFIGKELGKKLGEHSRIPVILKKELPVDTYYNDDDAIARMIKTKIANGNNITVAEIKDILNKREITNRVSGEYFGYQNKEPYIVIYYRNFNTTDLDEYMARIAQTLAHEYMHHIHNLICRQNFFSQDLHTKDIKEGIADFFAVMYSIYSHRNDKKLDAAEDRYKSWLNNFGSNWPYANALYFLRIEDNFISFNKDYQYYVDNGCIDKFGAVLDATIRTMSEAYSIMIG